MTGAIGVGNGGVTGVIAPAASLALAACFASSASIAFSLSVGLTGMTAGVWAVAG